MRIQTNRKVRAQNENHYRMDQSNLSTISNKYVSFISSARDIQLTLVGTTKLFRWLRCMLSKKLLGKDLPYLHRWRALLGSDT